MLKTILGVIVGYVVFSISLFVLFSGLYLILGADKSFMPGNFDLTLSWILPSIVVFFVAAALASTVCAVIAKDPKSGLYMGATIFVIGIIMAAMQIAQDPGITLRSTSDVGLLDAMNQAHGPVWSFFINPIAGFIGAVSGGNLFAKK